MTDMTDTKQTNPVLDVDPSSLVIVKYPDPRLSKMSEQLAGVDDSVRAVIDRMLKMMFESRGVGLAAPQVGLNVRLFVASPAFDPEDCYAFVNPVIVSADGAQEGEEGCLSLPGINCKVKRRRVVTIRAMSPAGEPFEITAEDFPARVFQHEIDHLDGRLLTDRMGTVAKLANRRVLKELEEAFNG